MKRIRITGRGIYGGDGELPIGTQFTVRDIPPGWQGRCEVVSQTDGKAFLPVHPPAGTIAPPPHPLDHDGDGKPGGSAAPDAGDDLSAVRAEYKAKLGKNYFPGWDIKELRRRIAEAG